VRVPIQTRRSAVLQGSRRAIKEIRTRAGARENQHYKLFTISQRGKHKVRVLGFEFRWGVSLKGKDIIKRRTAPGKMRKSLAAFTEWCKEMRNKRLRRLFPKLIAKLRGYNNYYGLIGNYDSLSKFHEQAKRILYKWLNRRSQRRSFNQDEFAACWKRYGVPEPRIVESDLVQLHFDF